MREGYTATGIDGSEGMLAECRRKLERRGLRAALKVALLRGLGGERRRLVIKWLIQAGLLVGGVVAVLWAVDQYVIPLEALWTRLLEKAGLEDIIRAIRARLA